MKTIIKTSKGDIHAELLKEDNSLQLNVFHVPNGGTGFFLVFPLHKHKEMLKAACTLIESKEQLPPDTDITFKVKGCLLAGTAQKMSFSSVAFGQPMIQQIIDGGKDDKRI